MSVEPRPRTVSADSAELSRFYVAMLRSRSRDGRERDEGRRGDPIAARRVTMPDLPIPFAGTLEDAALLSAQAVIDAVRMLDADSRNVVLSRAS